MRDKHLKRIDELTGYIAKMIYLSDAFLNAKTEEDEILILDMIKQLKLYGG